MSELPFNVRDYWDIRYKNGHGYGSGSGSTGRLGQYKMEKVAEIIKIYGIRSVVDFGCGDARLVSGFNIPEYLGLDISREAIERARETVPGGNFALYVPGRAPHADMAMALDVLYHAVDDNAYLSLMTDLFNSAGKYVLIYSVDREGHESMKGNHVRDRKHSRWVDAMRPDFGLARVWVPPFPFDFKHPDSTSDCSFFLYER